MTTGMYELDMFDDDDQAKPGVWELVDGIKLNQSRVICDGEEPVLVIGIRSTDAIKGEAALGLIYPLLVKRHTDGTVRQILINFDHAHELEYQLREEGVEGAETDGQEQ
jgi:hypothetical protein